MWKADGALEIDFDRILALQESVADAVQS